MENQDKRFRNYNRMTTDEKIEYNTRITRNCALFFTIITAVGIGASIAYGVILSGVL